MAVKLLITISLLLACNKSYSQRIDYIKMDKRIDRSLLMESNRIMRILKFPLRTTINRDGMLGLVVKRGSKYLDASFNNPFYDVLDQYDKNRVYQAPFILITELCLDISTKARDTTRLFYIRSRETIVHELTHYLQSTFDTKTVDAQKDFKGYVSNPTEFEAYSVGAYYFLENYNKAELMRIMIKNITVEHKCQLLINAFFKVIYPNQTQMFTD